MTADWAKEVLRFWFEALKPEDWFSGRPALDAEIDRRFGALHRALKAKPPVPAALDADDLLAAVIIFDQFSRNIHRGKADAFATDALALSLAEHAVERGLDRTMPRGRRMFLYMPFMHGEAPSTQARSVALFSDLGMPEQVRYAEHHRNVIDRFGRFPARNTALGRTSTPEERAFIESDRDF